SDPARPKAPPVEQRYPAAGTPNAEVSLWLLDLSGERCRVVWDASEYEYVHHVSWTSHGDPLVQVLSRDHHSSQILGIDPRSGAAQGPTGGTAIPGSRHAECRGQPLVTGPLGRAMPCRLGRIRI